MPKMLRTKYNYDTPKSMQHKSIPSDLGLIQIAQEQKAKQDDIKAKKDLKNLTSKASGGGGGGIAHSDYSPGQPGGGRDASRMGGGSRQAKSGGQKAGGTGRTDKGWGWKEGGPVGLASMFTRRR